MRASALSAIAHRSRQPLANHRPALWLGALFAGAIMAMGLAGPASAQSMEDELQRLQRELSDLQAYVYNGNVPSGGTGGNASVQANQEVRLQALDSQMSQLNGKFEDIIYQLNQLSTRLDKLNSDVDFRLSQLEQGQGAMAAGGAPAGTAPAGTAPAGTAPAPTGQMPAATGATAATPPSQPAGTQILGTLSQGQMAAAQAQQTSAPPAPVANSAYDLPGATPQEQYEYAFGLLKQANYAEAQQALAEFVRRNPTDVLAGNAQYWLGETFYVRGNYTEAAVAFAEGYQKYPNSGKAGPNLLKLGMALGELGKKPDACVAFSELLKKFPGADTDLVDQARREQQRFGCA